VINPEELLDRLYSGGHLTLRQTNRVRALILSGVSLEKAVITLPLLEDDDLEELRLIESGMSEKLTAQDLFAPAEAESEPTPVLAAGSIDLDLDLEDFDFGDHHAEPPAQPPAVAEAAPPPQAPALPPLPAVESLDDELMLDTGHLPGPSHELDPELMLDDELILEPEHLEPPQAPASIAPVADKRIPKADGSPFDTDISSLFDEVFVDGAEGSEAPVAEPFPVKLHLPQNPDQFLRAVKIPQNFDLAKASDDVAMAKAFDLIGESVVLGRRGIILNSRRSHGNVALYDPDGRLEEERTLAADDLRGVMHSLRTMARVQGIASKVQRGQCAVSFSGERSRVFVESDGAAVGSDQLTVYLMGS
jgi:hypothetical protein